MHRDLRVRSPSLRILIGICTRVLPHAVDRHAVLVDLALIGADEGQIIIVFTPGHQADRLQLFFVDPVGDPVHDLVAHGVGSHTYFGIELKLLDEDIPFTDEGDHPPIRAEGRDHHFACRSTQGLDPIATYVVVEDITLARATIDSLLVGDQQDMVALGLKDVVVELLEVALTCLVDAEERIYEFARVEAIPEDRLMLLVHHRVVLAITGRTHALACGISVEAPRGHVLDLEVFGRLLCLGIGACSECDEQ